MWVNTGQPALREPATALLAFVRCFAPEVYVSAPITTGRRYLAWCANGSADGSGSRDDHRHQVVLANLRAAEKVVRLVRERFSAPVVDPTMLDDLADWGWEQVDYHRFWVALIESYINTAVFVDGWEYSTGCAIEILTAYRKGIPVLDENLGPLAPDTATELVERAVADFHAAGLTAEPLAVTATELRTLLSG